MTLLEHARKHRLALALLVMGAGICGVLLVFFFRAELLALLEWSKEFLAAVVSQADPFWFLVLFALVPLLGAPITFFYLAAAGMAAVHGSTLISVGMLAALAVNMGLAYLLARSVLRPLFERFIARSRFTVPEVSRKNAAQVALMVRITPGLPFCVQSYMLGLAKIPFWTYLGISMAAQGSVALTFVFVGESVFKGQSGMAFIGICLLIIVFLVIHMLRQNLAKGKGKQKLEDGRAV